MEMEGVLIRFLEFVQHTTIGETSHNKQLSNSFGFSGFHLDQKLLRSAAMSETTRQATSVSTAIWALASLARRGS